MSHMNILTLCMLVSMVLNSMYIKEYFFYYLSLKNTYLHNTRINVTHISTEKSVRNIFYKVLTLHIPIVGAYEKLDKRKGCAQVALIPLYQLICLVVFSISKNLYIDHMLA